MLRTSCHRLVLISITFKAAVINLSYREILINVLASSVGSSPCRVKSKTVKLGNAASPLSIKHEGTRVKTCWLAIRINVDRHL